MKIEFNAHCDLREAEDKKYIYLTPVLVFAWDKDQYHKGIGFSLEWLIFSTEMILIFKRQSAEAQSVEDNESQREACGICGKARTVTYYAPLKKKICMPCFLNEQVD